jgi:hypothetical protein
MLGFGIVGTMLSILWWTPVIFHAAGMLPVVLFIGLPGISAALAGCAFGKPLIDSTRGDRPRIAALRGTAIGSAALVLFAPMFAAVYVWTSPPTEHWSIPGLALLVLLGSIVTVWWLVAAIGAAVGWALSRLASYDK